MSVMVPVRVTVVVPLPVMVAVPPVTARVPWATLRVTVMLPLAASVSAMLRPVMVSGVSSDVVCAVGTVLTGASLTALTVMATVSVSLRLPPVPFLPPSLVLMLKLSAPL